MRKRVLRTLLFLIIGYILLVFAAYSFQEELLFHPEKLPASYQFDFSYPFKEVHISTAPDVKINALFFPAEESQGLIVYFHGNAGSLRTWGLIAQDFLSNGYDVFMIDYREYGKSNGKLSQQALFADAQKVYHYAKDHFPNKKIVIYGRSLGTGMATMVAVKNDISLLILEAPYYSMLDLAEHLMPWLPHELILKYPLRTDLYFSHVKCPIVIFHGDQDRTIYHASSQKLTRFFKPGDEMVTIHGAGHNDIGAFNEYHQKLQQVLKK